MDVVYISSQGRNFSNTYTHARYSTQTHISAHRDTCTLRDACVSGTHSHTLCLFELYSAYESQVSLR